MHSTINLLSHISFTCTKKKNQEMNYSPGIKLDTVYQCQQQAHSYDRKNPHNPPLFYFFDSDELKMLTMYMRINTLAMGYLRRNTPSLMLSNR